MIVIPLSDTEVDGGDEIEQVEPANPCENQRYRHDTFIFWPVAGDAEKQAKIFLDEIMPEVRAHFVIPPKIENLYQDLQMGNLKK